MTASISMLPSTTSRRSCNRSTTERTTPAVDQAGPLAVRGGRAPFTLRLTNVDRRARVGAGGERSPTTPQPREAGGAVGAVLHLAVDHRLHAVDPDPDDRDVR